jgi:hypothetical protein
MATTTTTTTARSATPETLQREGRLQVDGRADPSFGDWCDDLIRDGYAIIKGAVPQERALSYADRLLSLAETL